MQCPRRINDDEAMRTTPADDDLWMQEVRAQFKQREVTYGDTIEGATIEELIAKYRGQ